jgi:hypothetical protein
VGRRSAENGAARLSVSGPSRSASKLVYPGCAYLAPSRHRILSVECLLLARSCRAGGADQCPKLGIERTQRRHAATAESDPQRTSRRDRNEHLRLLKVTGRRVQIRSSRASWFHAGGLDDRCGGRRGQEFEQRPGGVRLACGRDNSRRNHVHGLQLGRQGAEQLGPGTDTISLISWMPSSASPRATISALGVVAAGRSGSTWL